MKQTKVNNLGTIMFLFFMAVITTAAFLMPAKVSAKGIDDDKVTSSSVAINGDYVVLRGGTTTESSGVPELDAAKERTTSLVKWICRWVGGLVALVSLVVALFMASSHQTEQRNTALVTCAIGIVIAFAPDVIDYLLGGK